MTATIHTLHPEHAARLAPDSPAGKLMRSLEEMASATISEQLRVMFESADDLLFEMADKSKHGPEQRLFLDTMRTVRLERPRILKAFQDALHTAFGRGDHQARDTGVNLDDLESWSLQESTDLEEKIAVSNMDAKAETLYVEQLFELEQRLSQLASRTDGAVSAKALSPARILEAFQQSMKGLDIEFPIKLVIYKLFDRVVVTNLGRVFTGANQMLAEHGVDPKRPQRLKERASVTRAFAPSTIAGGAAPPGAGSQFQSMAGGLHAGFLAQAMQPYMGAPGGGMQGADLPAGGMPMGGMPMGGMPMGGMPMGGMPAGGMPAADGAGGSGAGYSNAQLANEMLSVMQAVGRGQPVSSWMPAQNLALVGRMFDDLYADNRLPEPARPVLSRLQFPVMKLALQDPSFFSNAQHPVRNLVYDVFDTLTNVRSTQGANFGELEQLIRELLQRFEPDPAKLRQSARDAHPVTEQEAERFLAQQQQRLDEQRKHIKEKVRRIVAQELRLHIGDRRLPKPVMSLLLSGFAPLLATQYLKGGADSPGWENSLELLDDLLTTLDADAATRPDRAEAEAAVINGVNLRLTSIGLPAEKIERLVTGLREAYQSLDFAPPVEDPATAPERAPAPEPVAARAAAPEAQAAALPAPATRAAAPAAAPPPTEATLPMLLRTGEWFKVWEASAHHCRWLKLTAYHPGADAVVFEDFGAQNFLKMRVSAFVQDLAAGRSAPVDPDPSTQKLIKLLPAPGSDTIDSGAVWYKANPMSGSQRA